MDLGAAFAIMAEYIGGIPVYSAFSYVSTTAHPEVRPDLENARKLILRLKDGDRQVADIVVRHLLKHFPELRQFDGDLVPVPRSKTDKQVHTHFAEALLAQGVGRRVVRALSRISDVPSSREMRRQGLDGIDTETHEKTVSVSDRVAPDVLLVDDVVTSGSIIRASARTLRRAGVSGDIIAVTAGITHDPDAASTSSTKTSVSGTKC